MLLSASPGGGPDEPPATVTRAAALEMLPEPTPPAVGQRIGSDTPGVSRLRVGGANALDRVPGNADLAGIVVAGYGDAGATVNLGSSGSSFVEQGDLNLVLNNWGSATRTTGQTELNGVLSNWGSSSRPVFTDSFSLPAVDWLTRDPLVLGTWSEEAYLTKQVSYDFVEEAYEALDALRGSKTLRNPDGWASEEALRFGRGVVVEDGRVVVGFEAPNVIAMTSGDYYPLGVFVNASRAYTLEARYDDAWGDPFAQGVGAAVLSSGELAVIVGRGTYSGRFDLRVIDQTTDREADVEVLVSSPSNRAPAEVSLPARIKADERGVWTLDLPKTDADGDAVTYDVSFNAPGRNEMVWNASAGITEDGRLVIDRETIAEAMDRLAGEAGSAYSSAWLSGVSQTAVPFGITLVATDGWTQTRQTATLRFVDTSGRAKPTAGLSDMKVPRASTSYEFEVPRADADGDAIDYDVWTSQGTAEFIASATGNHRVRVNSHWLGIEPIRVRLTMSDGGTPVKESFALRRQGGSTVGPYTELRDLTRDAAKGTGITVWVPKADALGNAFTYEAKVVPVESGGPLMVQGWDSQADFRFNEWSRVTPEARVTAGADRLRVVAAPDYVGDLAVVVKVTHPEGTIYDTFRVTIDPASTPRSLAKLIGPTRDVDRPSNRRGYFKQLPQKDDRGRTIAYAVKSPSKAWAKVGLNKNGQFGLTIQPRLWFGGSFEVALTASVRGETLTRRLDYTVAYNDTWREAQRASSRALDAASAGLPIPLLGSTASPELTQRSLALPNTVGGQPVAGYRIQSSTGRWATVTTSGDSFTLRIRPPGGFYGSFLVEAAAVDTNGNALGDARVYEFASRR